MTIKQAIAAEEINKHMKAHFDVGLRPDSIAAIIKRRLEVKE